MLGDMMWYGLNINMCEDTDLPVLNNECIQKHQHRIVGPDVGECKSRSRGDASRGVRAYSVFFCECVTNGSCFWQGADKPPCKGLRFSARGTSGWG